MWSNPALNSLINDVSGETQVGGRPSVYSAADVWAIGSGKNKKKTVEANVDAAADADDV